MLQRLLEVASLIIPVSVVILLDKSSSTQEYRIFCQRRRENGPLDGYWEFPGGKIEVQETAEMAASREFLEEVGFSLDEIALFKIYPFSYKDREVILHVFLASLARCGERLKNKGRWFDLNLDDQELDGRPSIPAANQLIISDLCRFLADKDANQWDLIWETSLT